MSITVLAMSDLHGYHRKIAKDIDIEQIIIDRKVDTIIISGDISALGDPELVLDFLDWFHNEVPDEVLHKVFILGNHERGVEGEEAWIKKQIADNYPNLTYLHHEHVVIDGIKIFGSPYTPYFHNWAYNVNRRQLSLYWDEIENDTDIIVTHGPPLGIGDYIPRSKEHTGCKALLDRVLEINPQVHQFGHIHEGHGVYFIQDMCKTKFVNASNLDGGYNIYNTYVVYEVESK